MTIVAKKLFPLYLTFFLGFLGLADALFLTFNHYKFGGTPCTITNGCETVTSSMFATAFGVPVALIGVVYYLTILVLAFLYADVGQKKYHNGLFYLTFAGSLMSVWFIFLQAFVISAWCAYCLLSAMISFTLLTVSYFFLAKN